MQEEAQRKQHRRHGRAPGGQQDRNLPSVAKGLREIAQEEERRITQLRQTLYAKKDQDMTDLRASTQEAVKSIREIYDQQHSILAQQIVDRIVGA